MSVKEGVQELIIIIVAVLVAELIYGAVVR